MQATNSLLGKYFRLGSAQMTEDVSVLHSQIMPRATISNFALPHANVALPLYGGGQSVDWSIVPLLSLNLTTLLYSEVMNLRTEQNRNFMTVAAICKATDLQAAKLQVDHVGDCRSNSVLRRVFNSNIDLTTSPGWPSCRSSLKPSPVISKSTDTAPALLPLTTCRIAWRSIGLSGGYVCLYLLRCNAPQPYIRLCKVNEGINGKQVLHFHHCLIP